MNRIEKKFQGLSKSRSKAFIAFITAGYPSLAATEKLILEFDRIGVDIIELGVPFSDPMADGPVIQEASQAALKTGVTLEKILNLVKKVRKFTQIPLCLMTYYNPVFCMGEEKFLKKAQSFGVDGVIIPDLPPEEGRQFIKSANKHKVDVICFISPTTSFAREKYICSVSKGFIYYVSLTGVTGARQALPQGLKAHLTKIKRITRKPICVGFGISSPQHVRQINSIADGVIVGSAIVKKIKENINQKDMVKIAGRFVRALRRE